CQHSYGTPITF
nr:immunoglobulin light chain junction region [Macaca mulatta]MOW10622.1 immunoglobulin light chain junction region [Macaca mulatta]